jgi:ABC-type transporter Mla subunit MlaD
VLAFGGGRYFETKDKAVLFFQGSLAGLDVGSPVNLRGVRVGSVTGIICVQQSSRRGTILKLGILTGNDLAAGCPHPTSVPRAQ